MRCPPRDAGPAAEANREQPRDATRVGGSSLWHRIFGALLRALWGAPGGAASESGRLRQGAGGHPGVREVASLYAFEADSFEDASGRLRLRRPVESAATTVLPLHPARRRTRHVSAYG